MNKTVLLVSFFFLITLAFSQSESNKQDSAKQENVKQENVKQENVKQEQESVKKTCENCKEKRNNEVDFRHNVKISESIFSLKDSVQSFVKSKSQIIFEFSDVNTFLYSVDFKEIQRDNINNEELSNNEYKLPFRSSEYKISMLDYADFQLPPTDNSKVIDSINKIEREIKYLNIQSDQFNIKLKSLESMADTLLKMETLKIEKEYGNTVENVNDKKIALLRLNSTPDNELLKEIKSEIDTIKNNYQLTINKIQVIKQNRDNYLSQNNNNDAYIKTFSGQLIEYLIIVSEINDKVDLYNDLTFLLFSNEKFSYVNLKKQEILKQYFGGDVSSANLLFKCNELFDKLDNKYYALLGTNSNMPDKSKIETSYSKLINYHRTIDKSKFIDLFKQILKIFNAINENNWTIKYQTTKISDKADKIHYSFELIPVENDFTLTKMPRRINYDFDIVGGVKIDVSAGLFYHFDLYDDVYRFVKDTDSTTLIIKDNNDNQFIPSLGALFNIYKRSNKDVKLALNFGAGTNIENLFYYFGASILLGKSERIGINGGLVGGTVKRISNEYKDVEVINTAIEDLPKDVPMQLDDPFQMGYFIGISYNLSGKNKETMEGMIKK
jgi:hypothetical protein